MKYSRKSTMNPNNKLNVTQQKDVILSKKNKDSYGYCNTETSGLKGISFDKYSQRKNFMVQTCSPPILTYIEPKSMSKSGHK